MSRPKLSLKSRLMEPGDAMWWDIVLSMPFVEALEELQNYRVMLMEQNQGKASYLTAATLLIRVNDNIKRINKTLDAANWQAACRNVLTPELYDAVRMEKRRLQGDL